MIIPQGWVLIDGVCGIIEEVATGDRMMYVPGLGWTM